MKALRYILGSALVVLSLGAVATPASAQATRTWVSGVGDDVNPCSRTAPCKTFAGAISKTAPGGEINCLDPAGFGAVTITKSITLDCTGTLGGVLASSTTGIIVNGANVIVTLRGLTINGGPPNLPGVNGIRFLQGASLIVQDSNIFNFLAASTGNGNGILVNNTSTTVELLVRNTTIFNNGEKGIFVVPTGSGGAKVTVERSNLSNNGALGIRVDTSATTGKIQLAVNDTVISGNANSALVAIGGTGEIFVSANGVTASNNGSHGIRASGANTRLFLGNSTIVGNGIGTEIDGGAILNSFGNNSINGNTANGPNPPVVVYK